MTADKTQSVRPPLRCGLEAAIKELTRSVKIGLERHGQYKTFQPPEGIPININKRPLHPENVSDTDWAIIFRHEFETAGYAGLTKALKHQAELHLQGGKIDSRGNYKIIEDAKPVDFMMILASMYPGFITKLIDGDLYFHYAQDTETRRAFDMHHALAKVPGNYLQGYVQRHTLAKMTDDDLTASTQAGQLIDNPHKGKGLTFATLLGVYNNTLAYLPSSASKDMTVVDGIDRIFPPPPDDLDYDNGQHKYVKRAQGPRKPGNEEKFNTWVKELKRVYIDRILKIVQKDPNDPILSIPMRVSLLEIGWGSDALARSSAHDDHTSSNYLWTFFQAVVRYCTDSEYGQTFTVERLATNFLTRGDDITVAMLDALLTDVGLTMIGRTEWFHSNLNPVPGGGAGVQKKSLESRLEWIKEQAEVVYASKTSRFKMNVEKDRAKIKALAEVESMTEQDFVDRERAIEHSKHANQKRWAAIQKDLKDLEDINAVHIAEDISRLGKQTKERDEAFLDSSRNGPKIPLRLGSKTIRRFDDIAEDDSDVDDNETTG